MSKQNSGGSYEQLGKQLRAYRTEAKKSLAESAGAVEIDVKQLANYELGRSRPSQEVLMLLVSHLDLGEQEAAKLWNLAGYAEQLVIDTVVDAGKPADKILFTDVVDVMVNNYGVVMNFMQSGGPANGPQSVARVGMSREHAKSVLKILQITLAQTEQGSPATNPANSDNNFSSN